MFICAVFGLIGSIKHIKTLLLKNQNRFNNNEETSQQPQSDTDKTVNTQKQNEDGNEKMDNLQESKETSFQVKKTQYQNKEDEELDIYEMKKQLSKSLFLTKVYNLKQIIKKHLFNSFAITKNISEILLGSLYPQTPENDILSIFDGIKVLFGFLVVIFNVRLTAESQIQINEFVSLGKLIDGFLFSSGFLNCYALYQKWDAIKFLRLYPLFWVTLMIQSTVKNEVYEQDFHMKERQNISCVKNFLLIEPGHCALWTWYVSLDLFIYIFMPLLTFIGHKNTKRGIFLVLTLSFLLLILDFFHMEEPKNELYSLYMHQGYQYEHTLIDINISLRICKYSIGVVTAFAWIQYIKKYQKQVQVLTNGVGGQIFSLIIYYIGYNLITMGTYQSREYVHLHWILANLNRHSFVVGFMILLLPGLLGIQDYLSSLLKMKLLSVLGRLTYGLYLTHLFVMWAFRDMYIAHLKQNEWLFTKSFVIGVDIYFRDIFIAFYLYIIVERPITKLAKSCITL